MVGRLVPLVPEEVEDLHRASLRQFPLFADFPPESRRDPRLRWVDGIGTRRGAGEGRQDRAPARGIPRADRPRSGADRAEPVGRRADRARSDCARGRPPCRLDRDVRRRLSRARARRPGRETGCKRCAAGAPGAPRAGAHAAERPRAVVALRRVRGLAARRARRARIGTARPRAARRRPRAALCVVPGRARPARPLGPRPAAASRRRAPALRARGLGRPTRLRLRLRGPDRSGVGAARGAHRPRAGDRLAALRAGARRVRVASPHAGRPGVAGGGGDRGSACAVGRVRACGARAPRTPPLRRYASGRPGARRRDPVLRGRRGPWLAGARRGGRPRARRRRRAAP